MIRLNDADDALELSNLVKHIWNPFGDHCICNTKDGKLLGGVIYTGYTGRDGSVSCHIGAFNTRWVSKDMLWMCFDYPFRRLGVRQMFGPVPSKNSRALAFNEKLGFRQVTVVPGFYPDDDMVLLSMYREDCKWLELEPRNYYAGGFL